MHGKRWWLSGLALGLASATLTALATSAPAAPAAPAAPVTGIVQDDTIEIGSSIEDHLASALPRRAANEVEKLNKEALKDAREVGLKKTSHKKGKKPKPGGDYPSFGNPGPAPAQDATADALVGTEKQWLSLDDTGQTPGSVLGYYGKNYRLAAVGDHIEVWVAIDDNASYDASTGVYTLPFDGADDCRNTVAYDGATRVEVTPAQINQLVADFDLNIYPEETAALATPPTRNGDDALYDLYDQFVFGGALPDHPAGYFATPGGGDRTVALIDNVRDDSYYVAPDQQQLSYIAGFFSSFFNAAFDRNVMTIDAYDWLHRTGADPRDDASTDPCQAAAARPFLYEGTFAHEWQHLLQSYVGGEVSWVNEGLSDWVQTLTGYVEPWHSIDEAGYDSHIQCFTGFAAVASPYNLIPRPNSGPENSLTWWEDQGGGEILCDYGAAYSFMEYVYGQLGQAALQYLFAEPAAGLTGVQAMLDNAGDSRTAEEFLHDWAAMMALDAELGDNRGRLFGGSAATYSAPTLDAAINWDENDAYDTPGAPPNGSDYVRLRGGDGAYLSGKRLRSVTFEGDSTFAADPTPWAVSNVAGDDVLYSQAGDGLDNSIAWPVTVPAADATLSFRSQFSIEYAWDYGFVQVSTDGGATWTSLANNLTTTDFNDNPGFEAINANLPGIGGDSLSDGAGGLTIDPTNSQGPEWGTTSFDLSAYAGQDVLIGFRYMTDGAFTLPGWWIDDVTVGGQVISDGSSLAGGQSYAELNPAPIDSWHVSLVGYSTRGHGTPAAIVSRDVAAGGSFSLNRRDLRKFRSLDVVGAIVTMDDPTEAARLYGGYELTANGVVQPGG